MSKTPLSLCRNIVCPFVQRGGEVGQEVVAQEKGDAGEQGSVDALAAQYVVDVAAHRVEFACQPSLGAALPLQFLFYHLSYMHRRVACCLRLRHDARLFSPYYMECVGIVPSIILNPRFSDDLHKGI